MVNEIVNLLAEAPTGIYVDATLGGAGHADAMLERRPDMSLVGIDRDPTARAAAAKRLARHGDRAQVVAGRFVEFCDLVAGAGVEGDVTAVLFDLGVSSPQLDHSERGFSYRHEADLDMRMNPEDPLSAAEIVNDWSHGELTRLLRDGADERFASRIAARIIDNRPVHTTTELAEIVVAAIPAATRRQGGHPAKRTFQALRIAVNDELAQLPIALNDAIDMMAMEGRGAVLTYHSGEDRIAKSVLTQAEGGGCTCPPRLPCGCGATPKVKTLAPKLRRPSEAEIGVNPRAASARLRAFRKITPPENSARSTVTS